MPIFSFQHGLALRRKISETSKEQHPVLSNGQIDHDFPWAEVVKHTTKYLKKKGEISTDEKDSKLLASIRLHEEPLLAVAATACSLSPCRLRELLVDYSGQVEREHVSLQVFLHLLLVVNHRCPQIINDLEAQRARRLLLFHEEGNWNLFSKLRPLATFFGTIPNSSFIYPHARSSTLEAWEGLAAALKKFEEDKRTLTYLGTHKATQWLSHLAEESIQMSPEWLLAMKSTFPTWLAWAGWSPNKHRLMLWKNFNSSQLSMLVDLIALEGPDFTQNGKKTLWRGLPETRKFVPFRSLFQISRGNLLITMKTCHISEAHSLLRRILKLIDKASVAGNDAIDMLAQVIQQRNRLSEAFVEILELVIDIGNVNLTRSMSKLFGSETPAQRSQALFDLIPLLGTPRFQKLHPMLLNVIVFNIRKRLMKLQHKLIEEISAGSPWENTASELYEVGLKMEKAAPTFSKYMDDGSWPCTEEDFKALLEIKSNYLSLNNASIQDFFGIAISNFCYDALIKPCISTRQQKLVSSFIKFWRQQTDDDTRTLALMIVRLSKDYNFIHSALIEIPRVLKDLVVELLWTLKWYVTYSGSDDVTQQYVACMKMVELLTSENASSLPKFWKPLADVMIVAGGEALCDWMVQRTTMQEWTKWLDRLGELYSVRSQGKPIYVVWSRLVLWGGLLNRHRETVELINGKLGNENWTACFKKGSEDLVLEDILSDILKSAGTLDKDSHFRIFNRLVPVIGDDIHKGEEVRSILGQLSSLSLKGSKQALWFTSRCPKSPKYIVRCYLDVYEESPVLSGDMSLLHALARVFDKWSEKSSDNFERSLDAVVGDVMVRNGKGPQNFDSLKETMLFDYEIAWTKFPASKAIASVSVDCELASRLKAVGYREIQMRIPLQISRLDRAAMGAGKSKNLILCLKFLNPRGRLVFCLHFDDESLERSHIHGPDPTTETNISRNLLSCGRRANLQLYYFYQLIDRHLSKNGISDLVELDRSIVEAIKEWKSSCLICGAYIELPLRRATICSSNTCAKLQAHCERHLFLSQIWSNGPAVDALLTFFWAAMYDAMNCERRFVGERWPLATADMVIALHRMESVRTMQETQGKVVLADEDKTSLLRFAINGYGGFLTEATSINLCIPHMPGWRQYVLTSAAANLEHEFRKEVSLGGGKTSIVYHGTTIDRVYSILSEGLQNMSKSAKMQNGSAYGCGIYVASEPFFARHYCRPDSLLPTWPRMDNQQMGGVFLGLEMAGEAQETDFGDSGKIWIVSRPAQLMVRYVFVEEGWTKEGGSSIATPGTIPRASTIREHMEAACTYLRSDDP